MLVGTRVEEVVLGREGRVRDGDFKGDLVLSWRTAKEGDGGRRKLSPLLFENYNPMHESVPLKNSISCLTKVQWVEDEEVARSSPFCPPGSVQGMWQGEAAVNVFLS